MPTLPRSAKLLMLLETQQTICLAGLRQSINHGRVIRALYIAMFILFLISTARIVRQIWINGGTTTVVNVSNGDNGEVRSSSKEEGKEV